MSLPEFAIRNRQVTWMFLLLLVLLGVASYLTMPRSEDPQIDFPMVVIKVVNPGVTPLDMEKLVVDPLEDELGELDDLKKIKTDIQDGLVVINIEFLYGSDADDKYDDVLESVNKVRADLPEGIVKLDVDQVSPSGTAILQVALTSDSNDLLAVKRAADKIENVLERIHGVKQIDIEALPDLGIDIQLDLHKLHSLGISLREVEKVLSANGQNIPGGHANAGDKRFNIITSGDYRTLDEIKNTVIQAADNQLVYLRDVATVQFKNGIPSYKATHNGKQVVFITVKQRDGSQILKVVEAVKQKLDELSKIYQPLGIAIEVIHDQSVSVDERIGGFFLNLFQGLIVVGLLVLLVLGIKPSLLVVLAIPLSFLIAIGWLDLAQFGLQQMSIVGLVIALGLLVDNAIVVVENIIRERDINPETAAEKGSSKVAAAISSGTITTVLAFVPMLLMQNGSGEFIRSMPVTVVLSLFASLLVALTFTPLISKALLNNAKAVFKPTLAQRKLHQFSTGFYTNLLNSVLLNPVKMIVFSIILFVAVMSLFPMVGVSLFPKAEKDMILVNIESPEGSSFQLTEEKANLIANKMRSFTLVKSVTINVGRGNPRIYYNEVPDRQTPNFAQLFVQLNTGTLTEVEPFVSKLRTVLSSEPGVKITVKEFQQGPPTEAPIAIRILGDELETLQSVASDIEALLLATKGTINVNNPIGMNKVDAKIKINRDKAAMMGIPLNQIDSVVRTAMVGKTIAQYKDELGDEYPIRIKSGLTDQPDIASLNYLKFSTNSGAMVPFNQVADVTLNTSIAKFQHFNLSRVSLVTSDILPEFNTAKVTEEVIQSLENYEWPQGVSYSMGGEKESRDESFGGMVKALLVSMLGIFSVLVMQFRSFSQPLIIFSAIPFAIMGSILALFATGYTFSFTAFIGLTSLVGIVVNNAIILVDFANQSMLNGLSKREAILEAAQTRFTPIILTSVTTIGGLIPLTLSGSSMWAPMGWAIIGGLVTSTLLSLLLVPVLYQALTTQANSLTPALEG